MKKLISLFLIFLMQLMLNSCATVFNTSSQEVEITTTPQHAKILVDGKKYGLTPQIINLERGSNHVIKLDLDGFEPYETQITRKTSAWVWFNVFNGFIPGFIFDYMSGSMYSLIPDNINIELQAVKPPAAPVKK